jgi:hypothetical protein
MSSKPSVPSRFPNPLARRRAHLCRHVAAHGNHPIYVARGNEQPLLQELVKANPPEGGMIAYVADLNAADSAESA